MTRRLGLNRLTLAAICAACVLVFLPSCRVVQEPRGIVLNPVRDYIMRQQIESVRKSKEQAPPLRPVRKDLGNLYEAMARYLTRAAAKYYPELYKQPRSHFEEMLRAMLGQAAYESGHFRSALAVESYNFWGMKDRDDVPAGRTLYKGEYYEKFSSMYAGCCGYMIALSRPYYSDAVRFTSDKKSFLKYIARSGWCPDRNYAAAAIEAYEADRAEIDRAVQVAVDEIVAHSKKSKSSAK